MDVFELREKSKILEPVIRIGKFGLTEGVFSEIEKLLKKRKLIKIKILNNCPSEDGQEIVEKILVKSNSVLVSKVGNSFTIYREKKQSGNNRTISSL